MINYDFNEWIQLQKAIDGNLIQKISKQISTPLDDDKFIDSLWSEVTRALYYFYPNDQSNYLKTLKPDVLMSLYTSSKYFTLETYSYASAAEKMKEFDSCLKNPESSSSNYRNLYNKRNNIQNLFRNYSLPFQAPQYDINPICYLKSFWDASETIKCFDLRDFFCYIDSYKEWPFSPKHCNGLQFFDYFKTIHNFINKWDFFSNKDTFDFQDSFSAYILEELFSPVSLITNARLHISNFEYCFHDFCIPDREKSLVLMIPLFKIPRLLWEELSNGYISSVKDYIKDPSSYFYSNLLTSNINYAIYYGQIFFTQLKILLANILYIKSEFNIEKIATVLEKYIKNNFDSFDYFTPLKKAMLALANYYYPLSSSSRGSAPIPYDIEGYNKFIINNPAQKSKNNNSDDSSKKERSSDCKRNSSSILSYEYNFTYYFFNPFYHQNFHNWYLQEQYNRVLNINSNDFINNKINLYKSSAECIINGIQTPNYLAITKSDALSVPIKS